MCVCVITYMYKNRPVNLLQSTQKYFIHIIIFGAMASDILSDILNPSADFIADVYDNNIWSSSESSCLF